MLLALAVVMTAVAFSLRRSRWARVTLLSSRWGYAALVVQALLYFPHKSGFRMTTLECQWAFGWALAAHSFRNIPHIVLFAVFFLLTYAQLHTVRRALWWTAAACMAMGLFVELAQGATRVGNCRMRDLIPDAAGTAIGAAVVTVARRRSTP